MTVANNRRFPCGASTTGVVEPPRTYIYSRANPSLPSHAIAHVFRELARETWAFIEWHEGCANLSQQSTQEQLAIPRGKETEHDYDYQSFHRQTADRACRT